MEEGKLAKVATFVLLTSGFAIVYYAYTIIIADDFKIAREQGVQTMFNATYVSIFTSLLSPPAAFQPQSTLARTIMASQALLAALLLLFILSPPVPNTV